MKIIAIETSHDDTSIVLYENKTIIKEIAFSQTNFHKQFGGTVPEYASRKHYENLLIGLKEFVKKDLLKNVKMIAYTHEPGLIGSLHMGRIFAKALAMSLDLPIRPINHMHGHVFSVSFSHQIDFPSVALIVSGGHSQIWLVNSYHDLKLLGQTKDDAIGEVYDKIAWKMKLGFPGGPIIDKLSKKGEIKYNFDLIDDKTLNFSFSGLKTKVLNKINELNQKEIKNFEEDICTSFQESVIKILHKKTKRAIDQYNPNSIILGGGVSANSRLRKEFKKWHHNSLIPGMRYTTDNAMMIAITADLKEQNKKI